MKEAVLPVEADRAHAVRSAIRRIAESYVGHPTCSATRGAEGMDPNKGFHCLGLVSQVLQDAAVIPERADGTVRAARGMGILYGKSRLVPHQQAQAGDLVFHVHMSNEGVVIPNHVGIYMGGQMVVDSPGADYAQVRRMRVAYSPYPYATEGNPLVPDTFYTMYRSVVHAPWHFQGKPL